MGESADLLCAEMTLAKESCSAQTVEKAAKTKKHMKVAQGRLKKWADAKRRPLEFAAGDHVFLNISPTWGSLGSATVGS